MSEARDTDRLFEAWAEATARNLPAFDQAGVRRRVLEAHGKGARSSAPWLGSHWLLAGAALTLALALALGVVLSRQTPTTFQVAGQTGQVGSWLTADASNGLPLHFSEGSLVALGAGSRARVSQVSAHGARVELTHGSVKASVSHRAGTDWTFGAGPFEVSVLGTELDVSWSPEQGKFELSVSRGSVLVRGPLIQGPQEVRAGQVCRVDLNRRLMELGRLTSEQAVPQAAAPAAPVASAAPPPAVVPSSELGASADGAVSGWLGLAHSGKHGEAMVAAERAGLSSIYRSASADSLLELAGAARLSGRPDVERAALLACRKRAAGQAQAAQAAYLLGRASAPTEAARWFETYLREQPRGLLAREASGRLIESYVSAGNSGAAAQAASRYLAAYPHGPHASMARRSLGTRSEGQD